MSPISVVQIVTRISEGIILFGRSGGSACIACQEEFRADELRGRHVVLNGTNASQLP